MKPSTLVYIIAGLMLSSNVLTSFLAIKFTPEPELAQHAVRFVLTCILAFSLVKGWQAGRWIAVVLLGLGGIGLLIVGLSTENNLGLLLGTLGFSVVYGGSAIALLTEKGGKHFRRRY